MDIYFVLIGLCFITLNSAAYLDEGMTTGSHVCIDDRSCYHGYCDKTSSSQSNGVCRSYIADASSNQTDSTPLKKSNNTSIEPTVSTPLNENNHTSFNQTDSPPLKKNKFYLSPSDLRDSVENFPSTDNRTITDSHRRSLRRRVNYLKKKMQSLEQNNHTSVNQTFAIPLKESKRNSSEPPIDLRKITAPQIIHRPRSSLKGVCSTYVSKTGKTASGYLYNPREYTAAHFYLPFNSIIMVSVGSQAVLAKVNDRSPFWKGLMVDLSLAAGKALNMSLNNAYHCKMSLLILGNGMTRLQDAYRTRIL